MSVDFFITDGARFVPVEYGEWWVARQRHSRLAKRYFIAQGHYLTMMSGKEFVEVNGIPSTASRKLPPYRHAQVARKVCSPEWRRALELAAIRAGQKATHLEQVARDAFEAYWNERLNRERNEAV